MSNKKKPKKLRRPNVPAMAAPGLSVPVIERRAGEAAGMADIAAAPRAPRAEAGRVEFDYVYVKRDLKRIGTLGAIFFAALFALSFFIR